MGTQCITWCHCAATQDQVHLISLELGATVRSQRPDAELSIFSSDQNSMIEAVVDNVN